MEDVTLQKDARLTIISNRAPYQLKRKFGQLSCEKTVGGLVSVLDEIMRQGGGTWLAWGGNRGDPGPDRHPDG